MQRLGHITFRYTMPIEETMAFELLYHSNLQMDVESKQHLIATYGAIFVWMFVDGKLAGETYGIPVAGCDERIAGMDAIPEEEKRLAMYCYSNTLLPPYHGLGYSDVMKAHWLGLVAGRGYQYVFGHARPGPSQALNARFGAEFLSEFGNWYGTGEAYRLYRLHLGSL